MQEVAQAARPNPANLSARRDARLWAHVASGLAALGLVGIWTYVALVLLPYTRSVDIHYGAVTAHYSDLYAPWVATRELLLNGRDPFSQEVTREIQLGVYGQLIDPASDLDQVAFAYPVYLILLLAPLAGVSFTTLQALFGPLALLATVAAVLLWLHALDIKAGRSATTAIVLVALGAVGFVNGVIVMQISLFIALLLAVAIAALVHGRYFAAGIILALCMVKPQVAGPLLAGLVIWSLLAPRKRGGFLLGFGVTMALLLLSAELLLPGWIPQFIARSGEYVRYAHDPSLLAALCGDLGGKLVTALLALGLAALWWRAGQIAAPRELFGWAVAATLCVSLLIFPAPRPYNEVLLFPAILLLLANWRAAWRVGGRPARYSGLLLGVLLAWPPLTALLMLLAVGATNLIGSDSATLIKLFWYLPFQTHNLLPGVVAIALAAFARTLQWRQSAAPERGLVGQDEWRGGL